MKGKKIQINGGGPKDHAPGGTACKKSDHSLKEHQGVKRRTGHLMTGGLTYVV